MTLSERADTTDDTGSSSQMAPSLRGPSMVVIASVLAVGVAMLALGTLLLAIVI